MNNLNDNLFIWSFDVKIQGQNKKTAPPYLLVTLSIFYDPETLEIKFFNYKVKKLGFKLFKKEKNDSLRKRILGSISKTNTKEFIELNQSDLDKLNKDLKKYFTKLSSIFDLIPVFGVSWKNIKNITKVIDNSNGPSIFYYLFELISNIDSCTYHECRGILENTGCPHYRSENYFKLFDDLSLKTKLELFLEQEASAQNTSLISNWMKKNKDIDDLNKIKDTIKNLLNDAHSNKLISESHLDQFQNLINNNKFNQVIQEFSTLFLEKNGKIDDKKKKHFITRLQQMILINAYYNPVSSENNQLNKNKESNDKNDSNFLLHNIIFYGVPGTGKTHYSIITAFWILQSNLKVDKKQSLKEQIEKWLKKEKLSEVDIEEKITNNKDIQEQLKIITLHQGYGYEDFIEGIRPVSSTNMKEKQFDFKIVDGIFKEMVKNAKENPSKKYVLIIDEINRGNLSKIFGECFTLIESNKRLRREGEKWTGIWQITLPNSGELFSIPNNVYIIGTMNHSDYSIAPFDFALRRRFIFEEIMPDKNQIQNKKAQDIFIKLNEKIKSILGQDKQIGHSYFMDIKDDDDFYFVWKNQIEPLLRYDFHLDEQDLEDIQKIYNHKK